MTLAILGGRPVRTEPFPDRTTMGPEEKAAVARVMDRGVLSDFIGGPGTNFNGGYEVRALEEKWAAYFGYRHAISLNSWTSGLMTCIGALQFEPGDEIVCPPLTMSASVIAGLNYGVVPVFADVDPTTYCLDPEAVEKAIGPRTKAIMAVHLFGRPADVSALSKISQKHSLALIEDAAQAPGARSGNRFVGGQRDLGGFSLNYHKHIHAGEGGIIVTDNDDLALNCRLIRNHGENAWDAYNPSNRAGLWGHNLRLSELAAAIASCQLDRLNGILEHRHMLSARLQKRLARVPGIGFGAPVNSDERHAFYVYPITFDEDVLQVSRTRFIEAVAAELPKPKNSDHWSLHGGYVKPLYRLPVFQELAGIGRQQFPFGSMERPAEYYRECICPEAERLHSKTFMMSFLVREPLTESDIDDFADAIIKVVENARALRDVPLAS